MTKRPVVSAGQYGYNLNQLVFTVDPDTGEVLGEAAGDRCALQGRATRRYRPTTRPTRPTQPIVDAAVAEADVLGARQLGQIGGAVQPGQARPTAPTREPWWRVDAGQPGRRGPAVGDRSADVGCAQIAFMNPGGLRADMVGNRQPARTRATLTYRQAADVQPFANTLVNMDLTGAQIKTVARAAVAAAPGAVASVPAARHLRRASRTPTTRPRPPGSPDHAACGSTARRSIRRRRYSVTVNSFLASGGDNFRALAGGTSKRDTGQDRPAGDGRLHGRVRQRGAGDAAAPGRLRAARGRGPVPGRRSGVVRAGRPRDVRPVVAGR